MRLALTACFILAVLALPERAAAGDAHWTSAGLSDPIESLLFLPDGTLLAGTSYGDLKSSPDSGATWTEADTGLGGAVVFDLVLDVGGGRVLVATQNGVYERALGGWEWSRFAPGLLDGVQVNALLIPEGAPFGEEVLAGAVDGVYRSSLSSPSWTYSSTGISGASVNHLLQADTVAVAATGGGIYFSQDGGNVWELRTNGLTVLGTHVLSADTGEDPPTLFAGTFNGVFRSRDWGANWEGRVMDPAPATLETQDLLVDGAYPASVYAAVNEFGTAGVYQSSDEGTSWRGIGGGLTGISAVGKVLAKPAADSRLLFAGTGSGVWVTHLPTAGQVTPPLGWTGATVTVTGNLFGDSADSGVVFLSPGLVAAVTDWSDNSVTFQVPAGAVTGQVAVARAGGMSNGLPFTIPQISLEDLDSESEIYSDSVLVRAIHPVDGVDFFRVLGSDEIVSWLMGGSEADTSVFHAADHDTSFVTFTAPVGGGEMRQVVMEYKVEDVLVFHDTAQIWVDLEDPALPVASLRDLDRDDPDLTDSTRVWFLHGGSDAHFMSLLDTSDVLSWHLWPSGQSVPGPFNTWVPYAETTQVVLTSGDEAKEVGLALRDSAGNTATVSASITVDVTEPHVDLFDLLDLDTENPDLTDSTTVKFIHEAREADSIMISGGEAVWWSEGGIGEWVPYTGSSLVTLVADDGRRAVRMIFADLAGNETRAQTAFIDLDDTPPPPPEELYLADIDSGSRTLTDSTLVLFRHDWPGADSLRVVPTRDVVKWGPWDVVGEGDWVASSLEQSFVTLFPENGVRRVVYEGRDVAGNTVRDSVEITLDREDPGAVMVEVRDISSGIVGYSDSVWVRAVHVVDDADSMRLGSNEHVAGWSGGSLDTWVAYTETTLVELAGEDGPKNFGMDFRDPAGNAVSEDLEVVLDRLAPTADTLEARDISTGTVGISDSLWVKLVHSVGEEADSMRLLAGSDDSLWSEGPADVWVGAADSSRLLLAAGDGEKWVYLEFRDLTGNAAAGTLTVTLDTADPTFFLAVHQNPILTEHLVIYAAPSESLRAAPSVSVDDSALAVEVVPQVEPILYRAYYSLMGDGEANILVIGEDPAGNVGEGDLDFGVTLAGPSEAVVLAAPGGGAVLALEAGSLPREVFLLALPDGGGSDLGEGALPRIAGSSSPGLLPIDWIIPAGPGKAAWVVTPGTAPIRFLPAGLALARPAEVRFRPPADPADRPEGWGLGIHRRGGEGEWEELPTWITTIGGDDWFCTRVDRLGTFHLAGGSGGPTPYLPREFRLAHNRPNPFNPETTILFDLPSPGAVKLEVYDVEGRLRARIVDSSQLPAGRHQVVFEGVDDAGRPLASGVYYYRLQWGERVAAEKMILLR